LVIYHQRNFSYIYFDSLGSAGIFVLLYEKI